jgi:thiol-disulfide isomerase/thioredoxin
MGVVLGVVVLAGAMVFALTSGEQAIGTTETDSWDLPALDGEGRVTLADFAGQPTVATFFASWCHVCQRELPGFGRLSAVLDDQVAFVGINTMNNGTGLAFARRAGIDHWPLARDIGGSDGRQLATNFGARGSPTTVLYDANGDVVDVTLGGMSAQQLAQKIEQFFGVGP